MLSFTFLCFIAFSNLANSATDVLSKEINSGAVVSCNGQSELINCSLNPVASLTASLQTASLQTASLQIASLQTASLTGDNISLNKSSHPASLLTEGYLRSTHSDTCIAPVGSWGPICTSLVSLVGYYPDQLISYSIVPAVNTPVLCKLLGIACYAYGSPCCFTLHPRTNAGYPIWSGPNTVVWGNVASYPQIQCYSTAVPTTLTWVWGSTYGTGLGCYNGTNCTIFGC